MADILDIEYINSLPQPFLAVQCGGWQFPINDIDVETGLVRIDVCGKLQVTHLSELSSIKDDAGITHDPDSFYLDEGAL